MMMRVVLIAASPCMCTLMPPPARRAKRDGGVQPDITDRFKKQSSVSTSAATATSRLGCCTWLQGCVLHAKNLEQEGKLCCQLLEPIEPPALAAAW
jgi:hypothetical protein